MNLGLPALPLLNEPSPLARSLRVPVCLWEDAEREKHTLTCFCFTWNPPVPLGCSLERAGMSGLGGRAPAEY